MSSPTPLPWTTLFNLVFAILLRHRLSFQREACQAAARYLPNLRIHGQENIPKGGGYVIVTNHYTRPGFGSWWLTLTISSAIPVEVHWIIAGAWREPHYLTPATRWAFRRMACVYNFSTMPPMPPTPDELTARAMTIRQVLQYARHTPNPVLGLAPEGGDEEGRMLRPPFPGTGRFMLHLSQLGLQYLPAGIFETDHQVHVSFGSPYWLYVPADCRPDEKDREADKIVMHSIARLLPRYLQGMYRTC